VLYQPQEEEMIKQFTFTFSMTVPGVNVDAAFDLLEKVIDENPAVVFENIVDYEETGCAALRGPEIKMATRKVGEA
jgi:hypothetical protein